MLEALLGALGGPAGIGALVGALLLFLARKYLKTQAKEKLLKLGVEIAYIVMKEIAAKTDNKVDDKFAIGLKALNDFMNANGQQLTPVDEEKAKALFAQMTGAEKKE